MIRRVPELDGLRAVAIALVVGCHYRAFAIALDGLPEFGWVGVDIFFVLSGYLITSVLLDLKGTERPFARFYSRRCVRIMPPLALALVAIAIASGLTGDQRFLSLRSLAKNVLFLQAFGDPGFLRHPHIPILNTGPLPLGAPGIEGPLSNGASVLWSLSIEEYFYLLWAPVVLCLDRRAVLRIGVVICVGELVLRAFFFRGRPDYFSIYHRFDALIYGAFAALLCQRLHPRERLYKTLMIASSAAIGVILWELRPLAGREIRDSLVFMVFGLPLVSIFVAAGISLMASRSGSGGLVAALLRTWPMSWLGRISYTAYLLHVLIYLSIVRVLGDTLEAALLAVVATIVFAALSWTLMEGPLLTGHPPIQRRRQTTEA